MDYTFPIGVIALIQVCLLPGLLALATFRLWRVAPIWPTMFALSLLANYVVVMAAMALSITSAGLMWGVITLECVALAVIAWRRGWLRQPILHTGIVSDVTDGARGVLEGVRSRPLETLITIALQIWVLWMIAGWFSEAIENAGDGFDSWDAVQSWNRWGRELAAGEMPTAVYHYPQLLPANYAVPYILTGLPDLTVFSASLDRLFFPMCALALFWFSNRSKRPLLLLSIPIAHVLTWDWLYVHRNEAYADIPVAFFCLMSVVIYMAPRVDGGDNKTNLHALALAAALAVGAAVTKQAGLYWMALFIVMVLIDRTQTAPRFASASARQIAWVLGAMLVGALSWYAYVRYQIAIGASGSEIGYVTDEIYGDQTPQQRFLAALGGLAPFSIACIALTALVGLFAGYRIVSIGLAIGFLVIWSIYFSYDRRNAAMALLPLALTTAFAVDVLVGWALRRFSKPRPAQLATSAPVHGAGGPAAYWLLAPILLLLPVGGFALARQANTEQLMHHLYLSEPELFGPARDDFVRDVARIVVDHPENSRVWSRDRYTCVLTATRILAQCGQLPGGEAEPGQMAPDLAAASPEIQSAAAEGDVVLLVLNAEEAPPPLNDGQTFHEIKEFNNFVLWQTGLSDTTSPD